MAQINTKIILRNDFIAEWESKNPILSKGEIGLAFLDSGKAVAKLGDGVKNWQDLEYFVGEELLGDNKSIKVADGKISLVGFEEAPAGAQPRKKEDGTIEWIIPSAVDVDELKNDVATLKNNVANLQTIIGAPEEGSLPLINRLETVEEKVVDRDSIASMINTQIDEFAAKVTDDGTVNTIKEVFDYIADHGSEFGKVVKDITDLQTLVGDQKVSDRIVDAIKASENKAYAIFEKVKYEISNKPVGTLVNYRDKELRVMVPAGTEFSLQQSGENADHNSYYIGFKAYAPEGAVSFKEDLKQTILDEEMYYFEGNDFAGVDEFGRKYSIVWLPVARFADGVWNYFGKGSSDNKFVGWYYSVEWYDADGRVIDSDTIRINLTNESCHNAIKPFYVPLITSSDAINKISIADDGTMEVNSLNVNKLIQDSGEWLVLFGGDSASN